MTTLILQVDIGRGTQWGEDSTQDIIRNICIPSVKSFAKKHGYAYKLLTKSTYKERIGPFDFLMKESKHFAFERYLNLETEFDNLVYVDNDIYISSKSRELPEIEGLMAVREPGNTNSQKMFTSLNNLPSDSAYYNSGLFMADQDAAKKLGDYMIHRAKNYIRAKGKSTDNMMFNEYILEENPVFSELNEEWNYMPMLKGASKGLCANFMHLVGIDGKNFLSQLIKTGHPLHVLLEKITTGEIKVDLG